MQILVSIVVHVLVFAQLEQSARANFEHTVRKKDDLIQVVFFVVNILVRSTVSPA